MKAMLSCNTLPDIDTEVPYPCLASAKLDGIRGMVYNGQLVSRTLKPIPNLHVRSILSQPELEGLDGELTLRDDPHNFNANQSAFMTRTGEPDFIFNVFDDRDLADLGAQARKEVAAKRVAMLNKSGYTFLTWCYQLRITSPEALRGLYDSVRAKGYEGLIMMHLNKPYKFGRSTLKQQISLKLKPSNDAEAIIIGMEELMHNLDAGKSNKKENMVPGGMMGALIGKMPCGMVMKCGTGFTHAQRQEMWDNLESYKGKQFTYKFMETFPDTGAPRGPVFKGMRVPE